MGSVLKDTTVTGVVTQTVAASDPSHLLRLGEARTLLTTLLRGAWNSSDTFTAGMLATSGNALYMATQTSVNKTPASNPSYWLKVLDGGTAGASSYTYIGYASDADGTDFALTPSSGLNYIAFKVSATPIVSPSAGDFTGLWVFVQGPEGDPGTAVDGDDGASAYLYIAYASDNAGTGFSLTASDSLNYIAIKTTTTAIVSPIASDFTGLWKRFGVSAYTATGPITLSGTAFGINAASANTASYVVQRDASGNFAAGAVTVTSLIVGSATLSYSASALQINQPVVATGLKIGSLSGVLKASTGTVAGSATTDDLTEGSTNKYFSAASVRATVLTGLSSATVILATDSILVAFGKLDAALAAFATPSAFTSNVTITPAVATSGSPVVLTVTGAANTTLTASTESSDVVFNLGRVVQFATGALGTQRAVQISAPSYGFVATSTITTAATVAISGAPIAFSNATVTNAIALQIAAGAVSAGNTNAFGLFVDAPTGATNNYCAVFNTGFVGIGTSAPTGLLDVNDSKIRIRTQHTPSSSGESGNAGELFADATYLYYRTATSTVKRIAWATF